MDYKIAVIGPRHLVSGFRALGIVVFDTERDIEAMDTIIKIKKQTDNKESKEEKFAVIIIIEELVKGILKENFNELNKGSLPAIITIPGLKKSDGTSLEKLRKLAERAIGIDILK